MKITKALKQWLASRDVVTQVRVSDTASDATRELNAKLAVMATRPIPVVTR